MSAALIAEESWVLLLLSGGEQRLLKVARGGKTRVGKSQLSLDPLIGEPFGSNFSVENCGNDGAKLVRDARSVEQLSDVAGGAFAELGAAAPDATNADLVDDGAAQSMGHTEVGRLRAPHPPHLLR